MKENQGSDVAPVHWKEKLHEIIFEADTKAGKRFDIIILWAIILSVVAVMLESVNYIRDDYGMLISIAEWFFTILFTIEYIARILTVNKPLKYIFSFFGLVDLLSILPSFIGLYFTDTKSLRVIRILRLMRIFRVLKLFGFLKQAKVLRDAMTASKQKIAVFLMAIMLIVVILGTVMYIIETPEAGFTSIPRSIYWAIVTLTTVGYGDIAPASALGQTVASLVMILGYAIIAVPTGIVTSEIIKGDEIKRTNTISCRSCSREGHADDAKFCRFCGASL
jgi:voltage-gated potassium channel